MEKVLSVSIGEIALKKLNRKYFEDKLIKHMRRAIKDIGCKKIYKEQGKIYIEGEEEKLGQMINRIKNIFGIVYISPCIRINRNIDEIETEIEDIKKASIEIIKEQLISHDVKTFKVETKRIDKRFGIKSPDFSRRMGGVVLDEFQSLKVDVHNPDLYLNIDIKQKSIYIYIEKIKGHGGLPVGSSGKALLLLSGGIDSPVAGFLMAKRGLELSAVHYHSYPFTSERAEEKVKELAEIISRYTGELKIYSVNILEIQKAINEKCPEREMTIISRRFMMRIAEKIAKEKGLQALITGESLGQVASQTIEGLNATNSSIDLPVFRPLIGLDKTDIVDISREIETYETSIQPFEDCCTVFLPKHPVTKPRLKDIEKSEQELDIESLINDAIKDMDEIIID